MQIYFTLGWFGGRAKSFGGFGDVFWKMKKPFMYALKVVEIFYYSLREQYVVHIHFPTLDSFILLSIQSSILDSLLLFSL